MEIAVSLLNHRTEWCLQTLLVIAIVHYAAFLLQKGYSKWKTPSPRS